MCVLAYAGQGGAEIKKKTNKHIEGNGESSASWWLLKFGRKHCDESESLLIPSAAASPQLRCVRMSVYVYENKNERRGGGDDSSWLPGKQAQQEQPQTQ